MVPFAPGGLVDIVGRLWADKATSVLGTIVVENQGGASGTTAAASVARSEPDGYTILLGNSSTQILTPKAMSKPPYDIDKDFDAIAILCVSATCIVVNPSIPANDLRGLIAYAKANPGKLSYGSAGAGSMTNLAGELFKHRAGLKDIVHIPYKGLGPAITDVIGGQIPMVTPNVTAQLLQYHRAGKIRILGINAPKRLAAAPEIPTSEEAGLHDMVLQVFNGLFAPAHTPTPIIARLSEATATVRHNKDFEAALMKSGFEGLPQTSPAASADYVRAEAVRLTTIVEELNFRVG